MKQSEETKKILLENGFIAEKLTDNNGKKFIGYSKYTGKQSEYSKTKQGNFMKVHPLDRI